VITGPANGGAEGGRTPDLLIANEALSQLSYGPARCSRARLIAASAVISSKTPFNVSLLAEQLLAHQTTLHKQSSVR
jgi:hypothetical protein